MFDAEKNPLAIHIHDAVPVGLGLLGNGSENLDAGIVDDAVQPAEALHGGADERLGIGLTANVARQKHAFAARLLYEGQRLFAPLLVNVVENNSGALPGEGQNHNPTQTTGRPGYDSDFVPEVTHISSFRFLLLLLLVLVLETCHDIERPCDSASTLPQAESGVFGGNFVSDFFQYKWSSWPACDRESAELNVQANHLKP
jgi:hypothetical protein